MLPRISPNIGLQPHSAEPPLAACLRSLELVAAYDTAEALPAHEYRFHGLGNRVGMLLTHHERRCEEVIAILGQLGAATVWQVTQELSWSRGWTSVTGFMRRAAIAEAAGDGAGATPDASSDSDSDPLAWYGDSAYGTGDLRDAIGKAGHQAVIKPKPLRPAVALSRTRIATKRRTAALNLPAGPDPPRRHLGAGHLTRRPGQPGPQASPGHSGASLTPRPPVPQRHRPGREARMAPTSSHDAPSMVAGTGPIQQAPGGPTHTTRE